MSSWIFIIYERDEALFLFLISFLASLGCRGWHFLCIINFLEIFTPLCVCVCLCCYRFARFPFLNSNRFFFFHQPEKLLKNLHTALTAAATICSSHPCLVYLRELFNPATEMPSPLEEEKQKKVHAERQTATLFLVSIFMSFLLLWKCGLCAERSTNFWRWIFHEPNSLKSCLSVDAREPSCFAAQTNVLLKFSLIKLRPRHLSARCLPRAYTCDENSFRSRQGSADDSWRQFGGESAQISLSRLTSWLSLD